MQKCTKLVVAGIELVGDSQSRMAQLLFMVYDFQLSILIMASILCPHCAEKTFSWWDKYRAGKWALLRCRSCAGRVCAQPVVLAVLSFMYVWDVVLFGYLAYLDSLWYLLVLVVGFLILDYFSVYVPLTPLRSSGTAASSDDQPTPTDSKIET